MVKSYDPLAGPKARLLGLLRARLAARGTQGERPGRWAPSYCLWALAPAASKAADPTAF